MFIISRCFFIILLILCKASFYPLLCSEEIPSGKVKASDEEVAREVAENLKTLPEQLPVKVETSFYLWNLSSINEKNGTFSVDFYLMTSWQDDRLASKDRTKPQIYTEDSAQEKLKEIWWPEFDFVNASTLETRNRTLFIYPSGTVEYSIKVVGTFFTPMNLTMFPFDKQDFTINLESFLWNAQAVQFVTKKENIGFLSNSEVRSLHVTGVEAAVTEKKFPHMSDPYSDFGISLHLTRSSGFFNYQILIPLIVVLLLNCAMFYLDIEDLSTRLFLAQGSILVFVAMKFMINQELPDIDYLTLVDYTFFFAYFCCCISAALSCFNYYMLKKNNALSVRMNRQGMWVPLILFFVLYTTLLLFAKVF